LISVAWVVKLTTAGKRKGGLLGFGLRLVEAGGLRESWGYEERIDLVEDY